MFSTLIPSEPASRSILRWNDAMTRASTPDVVPGACTAAGTLSVLAAAALVLGRPRAALFLQDALGIPETSGLLTYGLRFVPSFLLFFGLALAASGGLFWDRLPRWLFAEDAPDPGAADRWPALYAFLFCLPLYVLLEQVVFQRTLYTPDEFAYLYQAKLFASGHITGPAHPLQEFFPTAFLAEDGGRLYSIMPPGYSLFLVPWEWLGLARLANPVLSSLNVLLAARVGRGLYSRRTGRTAAFLMSLSPFFLFYTGVHITHALSLFLLLAAMSLYLRMEREPRSPWQASVLLGLVLAFIPSVHHFDVFLLVPVMFVLAVRFFQGPNALRARVLAVGALFLGVQIAATLWYQYALTGSPWRLPLDVYMQDGNFLGKPGFGIPPDGAMVGMASAGELAAHLARLAKQLLELNLVLFPLAPLVMLLPVLARERSRQDIVLAACLACMCLAYLFYRPGGGFQLGPRYYYLAVAFFYFLIVRGFRVLHRAAAGRPSGGRALRKAVALFFVLALSTQVGLSAGMLRFVKCLNDESDVLLDVGRWFERQGIRDSLVFVTTSEMEQARDPELVLLLIRNPPVAATSNLTARDLGSRNTELMAHHPGKRAFLYEVDRDRMSRGEPMRWREIRPEDYAPGTAPGFEAGRGGP